jgi:glucokinase
MGKYIIGVDVGGTNIKLGLVGPSGQILAKTNLSTKSYNHGRAKLIDGLIHAIQQLAQENKIDRKDILGVGIGLPGLVDFQKGVVAAMTNIPGWRDVPLKDIAQKKLKVPVCIDNDVNLITLGEWKFGAGRGCRNLVCMTLGTGVGGGLILNNALYRGEGFAAGEIGHIPLNEKGPDCNCGGAGCFERYVGNRYLLDMAVKIFKNKNIRLEDIFHLAREGNSSAVRFWQETAAHIGNALVGIINLLNPRLIIIGGGVSGNYRFMQETIRKVIRQRAMKVQRNMVQIVRARLGDEAGIIGAYVLVRESIV